MRILINGATIVTMNSKEEIIKNGVIITKDDKIEYIGSEFKGNKEDYDHVIDGENYIVIPGLVNAHNHSMSNMMKANFVNLPLEIWRQYVKGIWRVVQDEGLYLDVILGCIEMARNGITTSIDHFTNLFPKDYSGISQAYNAVVDSGIRSILAPMVSDIRYDETIPLSQYIKSKEVSEVVNGITSAETAGNDIGYLREFLDEFKNKHSRFHCMLGPASPQRCSKRLLLDIKDLAGEYGIGVHLHVLESKTQSEYTLKKFGKSAIAYMEEIGFLDKRISMAHVIWVDDNDINIIAKTGTSVVHNPVSNIRLGDGIAPIIKMVRNGVNVAFGTDGPCSNDSQNLFETLKIGSLLHNPFEDNFEKWISPKEALKMATINAANALNLGHLIGSLEKRKKADMVLLNRKSYPYIPNGDIYNQIVLCETGKNIAKVIIDGKLVIENDKNKYIDEEMIYNKIEEFCSRNKDKFTKEIQEVEILKPILKKMYYDVVK